MTEFSDPFGKRAAESVPARPVGGTPLPLIQREERIKGSNYVLDLSQQEAAEYQTKVLGEDFIVLPGVFSPKYFAETAFYTDLVAKILQPGQKYLDLGSGAGVTAVFAALKGAEVTALDLNPAAVENTKRNVELHGMGKYVRVMQSDVYSALQPGEKFNVIYWNCPFGYLKPGTEITDLQKSVFDVGYESNRKFIMGAREHLVPGGTLLMGVSTTLGQVQAIYQYAKEAGIQLEQIAEMRDPDSPPGVDIMMQLLRGKMT